MDPLGAVPPVLLMQESEGFVPKLGQVRGDDARHGVLHHGDAFQGGYCQAIQLWKGSLAFAHLSLLQAELDHHSSKLASTFTGTCHWQ